MPLGAARFGLLGGVADLGKLELIETQTITTDTTVDFTSIDENIYNVHFLTYNNMRYTSPVGNVIPYYRLSNDGGSTFESTNYISTAQFNTANGLATALTTQTTYGHLNGNQSSFTINKWGGYAYLYNLGDNTKYSFATFHSTGFYSADTSQSTTFGSSVYTVAETINAIRLSVDTTTLSSGTISLYGIAES